MNYPYYQSNPNGWGNNQFQFSRPPTIRFQPQPSWEGIDYFKAYAPNTDPSIFNQVYGNIFDAGASIHSLGVSMHEARIWHQRVYGDSGVINVVTPQEIGYASAYEAYRIWIHNRTLHEPLGGERDRQREALIGLAVAEASRMFTTARPGDAHGRVPACEAAAATASIIFDQSLMDGSEGIGAGMGYSAGIGYGAGMRDNAGADTSAYGPGFGMPGMAGAGMSAGVDPYTIDYEAPYFRQRMGRHRRLSMPGGMNGASRGYSPGVGTGGMQGSPYLGTGPEMGMGTNPAKYGRRSPMPGAYGGRSPMTDAYGGRSPMTDAYGGRSPMPDAYGGRSPMPDTYGGRSPMLGAYGGISPVVPPVPLNGSVSSMNASPMSRVSPVNITTVPTYPGTTTIIEFPRKHRHRHRTGRARSAESLDIAYKVGGPAGGAARAVSGAVGGIAGGAAGMVGGAVGGLARGAMGGLERGAVTGARATAWPGATRVSPARVNGPMDAGMSGYYPGSPNAGYGYPGYSIYRY